MALMLSGVPAGTLFGLMTTGAIVGRYGWPMVFYLFGAVGFVWAGVWFFQVHDAPGTHPRVTDSDRELIAAQCLPPGVYDVELDLGAAKVTVLGQDETFCRSMLEAVPKSILGQLKIEIENGALAVYWPTKVVTVSTSQCEFAITSQPVLAKILFAQGHGTGTADYAVGAQNHPGEKCEAKGAKLTLVRASS